MRSRLLQLRLWLEKNGVFPRSRLALITCYLLALGVFLFVVEKVAGDADGRIRNPVQRLRAQAHLVAVADALRINEGQPVVCELLVGRESGRRRSARKGGLVDVGWEHASMFE